MYCVCSRCFILIFLIWFLNFSYNWFIPRFSSTINGAYASRIVTFKLSATIWSITSFPISYILAGWQKTVKRIKKLRSSCSKMFCKKVVPQNFANLREKHLRWSRLLIDRSSRPEVFLVKGVLKVCSKFTGKHPDDDEHTIPWW